jgi:Tfp pilus assembly protein PilN
VRAVNLIPGDSGRRAGSGRAGSAAYYVLGGLGVLVVAMAVYVLTGNQVSSRQGELASATSEATSLEQQAAALKPYADFATLSQTRTQTVTSLADSRFDWERAMRDLARALPENVWLTSLTGTVKPGVSFDGGGGGAAGSLRAALQSPAIEMLGCTESQSEVSRVIARLRTMRGVQRVSLASSEKAEGASGPGGGGSSAAGGDCRQGSSRFPQFNVVVFFDTPETPAQAGQAATPNQAVNSTSNGSGQ